MSYNEVSGRYSKIRSEPFVPSKIRRQQGKVGSYQYSDAPDLEERARTILADHNQASFERYEELLEMGVAKEQARLVLPVSTTTSFYVSANPLNWLRFFSLRCAPEAMAEIREAADACRTIFSCIWPVTAQVWSQSTVETLEGQRA